LDKYTPKENDRLILSNNQYALLKHFHRRGINYTIPIEKALLLDQRSFGPAVARGLIACDGSVVYMTEQGHTFVEHYEQRNPWKSSPSQRFSHYIKAMRTFRTFSSKRQPTQVHVISDRRATA
jgi:hypothetical protein